MAETIFGSTVTLSSGRVIPFRWIGEQHVREDLGFIPSFADWVKAIRPEAWMGRALRLEDAPKRASLSLARPHQANDELELLFPSHKGGNQESRSQSFHL